MWFESLTGFAERSPQQVRLQLKLTGDRISSLVNGKTMVCGRLETPDLRDLRDRIAGIAVGDRPCRLSQAVGDVQELHVQQDNENAVFQVASQFNLLEMASPSVTPEAGVGIYETDFTQGPACAIAAGAGTIFRNYFAEVNGHTGQSSQNQIDCLADLGRAFGNEDGRLWSMKNGYALASADGLEFISQKLRTLGDAARDRLRALLRIGVQWNTQVTLPAANHLVTQVYGSALPISYCGHAAEAWSAFAQLVLESSYEAALCVAILNREQTGNNRLFLTLLGGGAFGNPDAWIIAAIERALRRYADFDLDVAIVSYRAANPRVTKLVESW